MFIIFISVCPFYVVAAQAEPAEDISDEKNTERFLEDAKKIHRELSFENVLFMAKEAVRNALTPSLPIFSGLAALIVLSAVTNSFSLNFGGFDVGGYVSTLCISGYTFSVVKNICESVTAYTGKLRDTVMVMTPSLVAAGAADGIFSAQTGYAGLSVALAVTEYMTVSFVLPCVKILFVMSLVSAVSSKAADLRGITSSLRTFSIFCVSLAMTAVVTLMHFQNVVAKAADSIGMRAARFASINFVPIIGAVAAESVKTVGEALKAVSWISGAAGVAAIISVCLPPLAAIAVFKIELIICTCLARTLGCTCEAALISDTAGILNVLNAALISVTVAFLAVICILVKAV